MTQLGVQKYGDSYLGAYRNSSGAPFTWMSNGDELFVPRLTPEGGLHVAIGSA